MMDPAHNEQAVLSDQVPTPLAGPSEAALNLTSETALSLTLGSLAGKIREPRLRHILAVGPPPSGGCDFRRTRLSGVERRAIGNRHGLVPEWIPILKE